MPFRYLLDEHLPRALVIQLRRRDPGLAVWLVGDPGVPAKGTSDTELLRWCEEVGALLVTDNRRSMPGHLADHLAAGGHVPGIFVLRRTRAIGDVVDDLMFIAGAAFDDEFRDRIIYVPLA